MDVSIVKCEGYNSIISVVWVRLFDFVAGGESKVVRFDALKSSLLNASTPSYLVLYTSLSWKERSCCWRLTMRREWPRQ